MKIPVITTDHTCDFAEHWKVKGMFVPQSPDSIQFATDWANICIASFVEHLAEAQAKKKAALAGNESKIVSIR